MSKRLGSTLAGPIARLLSADHARLEALLEASTAVEGVIAAEPFAQFRAGLLRHIGLEEKLLFPAARRANGDRPLPDFERLRKDHGELVALLVPTPTPAIVARLDAILRPHDALEEGPEGVYAACERLVAAEGGALLERLRDAPAVPVRPYQDRRPPRR